MESGREIILSEQQQTSFDDMPHEVVMLICYLLIPSDITSLMFVSRAMYSAIIGNNLPATIQMWNAKFAFHYPEALELDLKQPVAIRRRLMWSQSPAGESHYRADKLELSDFCSELKVVDHKLFRRLLMAAKEGDIKTLQTMIPDPGSLEEESIRKKLYYHLVDVKDFNQKTPLYYARRYKRQAWLNLCYEVMRWFPQEGDPITLTREGARLHQAIQTLQPVAGMLALLAVEKQNSTPHYMLHFLPLAAECGHLEFITWSASDPDFDFAAQKNTLLKLAIQSANTELVGFLLEHVKDNFYDRFGTELENAMATNDLEMVKLVLARRPESFRLDTYTSNFVIGNPHFRRPVRCSGTITKFFLDVQKRNVRPDQLITAATTGNFTFLVEGIRRVPEYINTRDSANHNLLHLLFSKFNMLDPFVLNELLSKGSHLINERDVNQLTPLQLAIRACYPFAIIRCLIDAGADTTVETANGENLIQLVLREYTHTRLTKRGFFDDSGEDNTEAQRRKGQEYGQNKNPEPAMLDIIKLLHEKGVNIDSDVRGVPPLLSALHQPWGSVHAVSTFLIQQGANVEAHINNGETLIYRWATGDGKLRELADGYVATIQDPLKRKMLTSVLQYLYARYDSDYAPYLHVFCIRIGCSRSQKLAAVNALITAICSGDTWLLQPHAEALNQGRLGKLFNSPEMQQLLGRVRLPLEQVAMPRQSRASL